MGKNEFLKIRRYLGKTQSQMAQLLGISIRTVQSFEQGKRNIPAHVERQALYLLAMKKFNSQKQIKCWDIRHCPLEIRQNCPAWEFQNGHLCWFINGTICYGEVKGNWKEKMETCRNCQMFISTVSLPDEKE